MCISKVKEFDNIRRNIVKGNNVRKGQSSGVPKVATEPPVKLKSNENRFPVNQNQSLVLQMATNTLGLSVM